MTTFILAAGNATRLGGAYKPHVMVAGKRVIDWQLDMIADPDVVVVKRSEHPDTEGTTSVNCDDGGGPVKALLTGLEHHMVAPEPITVLFADTIIGKLPPGGDLVLTAFIRGSGRPWDWWGGARYYRTTLGSNEWAHVCVGAYKFTHGPALIRACSTAALRSHEETPLVDALNIYAYSLPLKAVRSKGWLDVGDPDAIAHAESELRKAAA